MQLDKGPRQVWVLFTTRLEPWENEAFFTKRASFWYYGATQVYQAVD